MNCGLGNLFDLKRELLLASDASGTDLDAAVQELGLGVASLMESYCDRRFARLEDDQFDFDPYSNFTTVRRYPIESIASISLKQDVTEGFVIQDGQPQNFRRESGIVFFGCNLGFPQDTGRIVWTGGYFFEHLEPDDVDYPTTMPTGAEPLPLDLKLAWLKQCKFFWDRRSIEDRAKAGFKTGEGFLLVADDLLATVKRTLDQYRRFA